MGSSGQAVSNGYVLSKLAAERFVHRAFRNGLQGAVFRPGMLWGNSTTGCREHERHISHVFHERVLGQTGGVQMRFLKCVSFLLLIQGRQLQIALHEVKERKSQHMNSSSGNMWKQWKRQMSHPSTGWCDCHPVQVAAIPTSFLLALSPAALVLAVLLRRDLDVMWLRWTTLPRSGDRCQI